MILDLFRVSLRNLARRRTRSYLTMIGIFIGIAAVVSLIGLGEGLRTAITSQFGFLGTDMLTIQAKGVTAGPPGTGAATPLEQDLVREIEDVDGLETVFGRYITSAKTEVDDFSFVSFVGSIPNDEARRTFERMFNLEAEKGRLLKDGDNNKVMLGNDFMESTSNRDGLRVGDSITIKDKEFEIVGFIEKKGSFTVDSIVFMNEDTMKDLFEIDETVDVIIAKARDVDDIPKIKEDIEKVLRKERDVDLGDENFEVQTPEGTLETLNSTLFAVQLFVTIIALISILVGGIGITNTMYTSVLERTKEIGILKSIGARNSMVFSIFLMESGLLGMMGGLIGILLGLSLAYGLAGIARVTLGIDMIQAQVSLLLIAGSLVFSFLIGTISGALPAYQASKKNPVDALRFAK
ncbi:MAG: ABC transporter permease [Candidatus Woesearchaeota archaeon]